MGVFRRRREADPPLSNGATPERTPEADAFADALRSGDLNRAAKLATAYTGGPSQSLLSRSSGVLQAVAAGELDSAVSVLASWESPFAADYEEPMQRLAMNALGMCLVAFFEHPLAPAHPAYDAILSGQFRDMAKEAHRCGEPLFGDRWAAFTSQRAQS